MYLEEKVPLTLTTTEVAITFSLLQEELLITTNTKSFLRTNVDLVFVVY